MEHAECKTRGT